LVKVCGLAFLNNPEQTWQLKPEGGKPIRNEFIVKTSTGPRNVTVKFAAHGDFEKSGFKAWERTLTVGAGASATVNATLDKD
jgi:hypothetical protein